MESIIHSHHDKNTISSFGVKFFILSIYDWISLCIRTSGFTYIFYWLEKMVGLDSLLFSRRWIIDEIWYGCNLLWTALWADGFPICQTEKMGSADLVFIVLYTSLLGAERMLVCLMTAAVLGLLIGIGKIVMNSKNRLIPFVSCLNVGFLISYAYGYSIYFSSIQMLSFNF